MWIFVYPPGAGWTRRARGPWIDRGYGTAVGLPRSMKKITTPVTDT